MPDTLLDNSKLPPNDAATTKLEHDCEELAHARPGDTHKISSLLLKMIGRYYEDVLSQAKQSFWIALGAAVIGTLFFIYAAYKGMDSDSTHASLIAGVLIQVISAISFGLYARTSRQFAAFHICLERSNRFLLANTLCENIQSTTDKDQIRAELICLIANAPMLTMDMMAGGPQATETPKAKQRVHVPQQSDLTPHQ